MLSNCRGDTVSRSQAVRYVQYFVYLEMTMIINKLHPSHLTYSTYKLDEFDEYNISLEKDRDCHQKQ